MSFDFFARGLHIIHALLSRAFASAIGFLVLYGTHSNEYSVELGVIVTLFFLCSLFNLLHRLHGVLMMVSPNFPKGYWCLWS